MSFQEPTPFEDLPWEVRHFAPGVTNRRRIHCSAGCGWVAEVGLKTDRNGEQYDVVTNVRPRPGAQVNPAAVRARQPDPFVGVTNIHPGDKVEIAVRCWCGQITWFPLHDG